MQLLYLFGLFSWSVVAGSFNKHQEEEASISIHTVVAMDWEDDKMGER
jgi:hypothetical protein